MTDVNLNRLARQQRTITGILLLLLAGHILLGLFVPLGVLIHVIMLVFVLRMLRTMHIGTALTVSACTGMLIPIVNVVVLLVVNQAACSVLRQAGLRVGPLGVRQEDLSRIGEITGRCTHCWYDLTGNVSGYCPECGTRI